jgi:hypothetical protein
MGRTTMLVAALVWVCAGLSAQTGTTPGFSRTDVAVGANPTSIVAADFNADGRTDLAVANTDAGTIAILLGHGTGAFTPHATLATGPAPRSLHAADLDGNGTIDLVAADSQAGTLTVLLGIGDGSFHPRREILVAADVWEYPGFGFMGTPLALDVADYDDDGRLDVAVTLSGSNQIHVLLGAGDGAFPVLLEGAASLFDDPVSLASGDFTGDGRLDLVAAHLYYLQAIAPGLGTGWFGFYDYSAFQPGPYTVSVAVGDLNGDGRLDLVFADNTTLGGTAFGEDGVTVLLADGAGSFRPRTRYAAGARPVHVTTGDFNGDGRLGVAVANFASNTVTLLPGDGAGALGAPVHLATGAGPSSIAVGDFNGDGALDLAVANAADGTVSIFLNEVSGCAPDVTAPAIRHAWATPSVLWPPSGRLEPVTLGVTALDACSAVQCRIESVSGTEPGGPSRAGWHVTGDLTLLLRSARLGSGAGREYRVTLACTDASGNIARHVVTIGVPHDRRAR